MTMTISHLYLPTLIHRCIMALFSMTTVLGQARFEFKAISVRDNRSIKKPLCACIDREGGFGVVAGEPVMFFDFCPEGNSIRELASNGCCLLFCKADNDVPRQKPGSSRDPYCHTTIGELPPEHDFAVMGCQGRKSVTYDRGPGPGLSALHWSPEACLKTK